MRIHNVLIVSALLVALLFALPRPAPLSTATNCTMTTLDIGQGDAILFTTPDHHTILFDGGPGNSILDALGRTLPAGTRTIDLVVLTHPDADHLGGLVPVLERYDVQSVLTTGVEVKTQLFQRWQKVLADEQATILHAQAGQVTTVGADFRFEQLWPQQDLRSVLWTEPAKNGTGGINDTSVGGRVTCAGSTAMMTGDLSHDVEEQFVKQPETIRASVLKAGHHGSRYSSALVFLQVVKPDLVVFSVGKKNRYGHPHPTVLDRINRLGIPFFRTDEVGDITLVSTGGGKWVKK